MFSTKIQGVSSEPSCEQYTPRATPPGSVRWYVAELDSETGVVFSDDTLFPGGPGTIGRSFSDFRQFCSPPQGDSAC